MRIVARLAVAIATLLGSALLCWGQPPAGAFVGQKAARRVPAQPASQPSYEPPASMQGTWVSDDDEMPEQPPEQLGFDSFEFDQSMAHDCDSEACRGEWGECDAHDPRLGHGHMPRAGLLAPLFAPLWCSDMWNDVHAHRRVYAQVDYLHFWNKGNQLPPLVTTSPLGTPQGQAGVLPESATTAILFGNERVDGGPHSGGRINLGYWLIDGEFLGVEGQYFTLGQGSTSFDRFSDFSGGDPDAIILARPFVNYDPGFPEPFNDAAIVAFPDGFILPPGGIGTLDGGINIRTTSNLQSAGALLRRLVWIDFTMQRRLDLLLGYRFLRIDDSVTIDDQSTFIPSQGSPITNDIEFISQDLFSSSNQFHGGEIGLKYQSQHGRLSFEGIAKCAFGNNRQRTFIDGWNILNVLDQGGGIISSTETEGGLLAQPTNMGTHRRDVFAVLPEANANLRWDVTCNLRATVGYTFIYINRVQRSGSAIDLGVNPTQFRGEPLDGEARPEFLSMDTTYWVHGITGGLEYRW